MRIEIYELRRTKDGFGIDEKRHVATVVVKDGKGILQCQDKRREKSLSNLFENPLTTFVAGGKKPDGAHWDAVTTYPAWSKEAIDQIVEDTLRRYNLGAIVIKDSAPKSDKR